MSKNNVLDMTTGNETSLLLKFAIPMLIGNIFQQLYNMADAIIVGHYVGAKALGAVGSVGSINFIFFSLCLGLTAGIGILVSQYFGAKNDTFVKKMIGNSIYLIGGVGLLVSIISVIYAGPILSLMDTPQDTFADALSYMRITCGATIIVAIYNGISSILRALGDSKTPLIFLTVACFINIVLDFVFILVFDMGVAGTAWATIISQAVSAIGSIVYAWKRNPYLKLSKEDMAIDYSLMVKSVRTGMPVAAQNAMIAFSCIALQRVVNGYGSTIMAAYTATGRVEQLIHQPFNSLGMAMSTFAGQNMGANKLERVTKGCKKAEKLVFVFSIIMLVVMFLFDKAIVSIFIAEPEIIEIGGNGLKITSVLYFALGSIYVIRGALNGVGDVSYAMINGICEVIGRVFFAFVLGLIPGVGFWSVWLTNGFTWVVTAIAGTIRFVRGRWKTKVLIN
ncbi:MAG: MATE family efflux transporter [Lachnospiraceae bacterium]|nr:MATE family efflux transporter [Lachnospiraceae bacterium]